MNARAEVLAALAVMIVAVAPAATKSQGNPVGNLSLPDVWKRDTQFLEIWWNEARPARTLAASGGHQLSQKPILPLQEPAYTTHTESAHAGPTLRVEGTSQENRRRFGGRGRLAHEG